MSLELEKQETFTDYLIQLIPMVRPWGEDLTESQYYASDGGKAWLEINDRVSDHNQVLHFFFPNGEYMKSSEGLVSGGGKWRLLDDSNKIIISPGGGPKAGPGELYELAFLDSMFFILRRHGTNKFLVLGWEPVAAGLTWRDYVELLANKYREQQTSYRRVVVIIVIILVVLAILSIY